MPNQLINYFRDCYLADQRELTVWSLFDSKIEHLSVLEGEEQLINGRYPKQYLETEQSQQWLETLQVYSKEKELLYFSLMVAGKSGSQLAGRKQLCAPLVYYPVEISKDEDDFYYASINFSKRNLNFPLLSLLNQSEEDSQVFLEHIFKEFPAGALTFEEMEGLRTALSPYFPQVDFSDLLLFPNLADRSQLKSQQRSKSLKLMPASAIGVVRNSRQTRGVLNELRDLSEQKEFASPIKALFKGHLSEAEPEDGIAEQQESPKKPITQHKQATQNHYATSLLSGPQYKILENASEFPISVAVGPPGTGKSYTISAIAIDQISQGNSVLIASRMNHAVDVVADKIEEQLGLKGVLVRAGRSDYLKELKKNLQNIFSGISAQRKYLPEEIEEQNSEIHWGLSALNKLIAKHVRQFDAQVQQEKEWAKYLYQSPEPNWFGAKWLRNWKTKQIGKELEAQTPLWRKIEQIREASERLQSNTTQFLQARNTYNIWKQTTKGGARGELKKFLQAIRSRTGGRQEQLFSEIDFERVILHTFPIWLVNLADINEALPMQREMFDVAIIDEATQCDIASCLPILQRAKRLVVVGDPHQLRHLSFLSQARKNLLLKENGFDPAESEPLDYREKSILDFALEQVETQEAVTFLDEHFRSHPQIIGFSNQQFYEGNLRLMQKSLESNEFQSLHLVECHGTRLKNGTNPVEADQLFERIGKLMDQEAHLPPANASTMGILSPFREQVEYLRKRLMSEVTPEQLEKHQVLVGTAHSFQGEEREIMFLSFAVDDASAGGSFTHLNKPDVFNVSITRAKRAQYVLLSASPDRLNPESLLFRYLTWIQKTAQPNQEGGVGSGSHAPVSLEDAFMKEVVATLEDLGYVCFPQFFVAGIHIDLVVSKNSRSVGIDLIGWEGAFYESFSLERYQILQRAGFPLLPLTYTAWQSKRTAFLGELEKSVGVSQ